MAYGLWRGLLHSTGNSVPSRSQIPPLGWRRPSQQDHDRPSHPPAGNCARRGAARPIASPSVPPRGARRPESGRHLSGRLFPVTASRPARAPRRSGRAPPRARPTGKTKRQGGCPVRPAVASPHLVPAAIPSLPCKADQQRGGWMMAGRDKRARRPTPLPCAGLPATRAFHHSTVGDRVFACHPAPGPNKIPAPCPCAAGEQLSMAGGG